MVCIINKCYVFKVRNDDCERISSCRLMQVSVLVNPIREKTKKKCYRYNGFTFLLLFFLIFQLFYSRFSNDNIACGYLCGKCKITETCTK